MKFASIVCLLVSLSGAVAVSLRAGDRNLQDLQPVQTEPVQTAPIVLHNCASASDCSNQQWCDGEERCEATDDGGSYCVQQLLGPCDGVDDGVGCTVTVCNNLAQSCDFMPYDSLCDDGKYCNGVELCDGAVGCLVGLAPNCEHGCDETTQSCNLPPNVQCSDLRRIPDCHSTAGCQWIFGEKKCLSDLSSN